MKVVTSITISDKSSRSITLDLTKDVMSAYSRLDKSSLIISSSSGVGNIVFDSDFYITFLSDDKETFTFNKGDSNSFSILEDKFNNIYSSNCDDVFMSFVVYKADKYAYEFAKNIEFVKFDGKDLDDYDRNRLRVCEACDFGMYLTSHAVSVSSMAKLLLVEKKTVYYCKSLYKPDTSGGLSRIGYDDDNYYWIKFNNEDKLRALLAKMDFLNG